MYLNFLDDFCSENLFDLTSNRLNNRCINFGIRVAVAFRAIARYLLRQEIGKSFSLTFGGKLNTLVFRPLYQGIIKSFWNFTAFSTDFKSWEGRDIFASTDKAHAVLILFNEKGSGSSAGSIYAEFCHITLNIGFGLI